jgi:hypothetical protein
MSDAPQGPGWWEASDGKWYPPQAQSAPPQPQSAAQGTPSSGPLGVDRSPGVVLGLSIVTLGIYFLVWYYKINDEIRRHDPLIKVSPGWSVVAMFIPIANLVSGYSTAARIRQMQLDEGATQTISPVVALLLQIFIGIGYPLYVASQLREHWHGHRRSSTQSIPAPHPGVPIQSAPQHFSAPPPISAPPTTSAPAAPPPTAME